MQIYLSFIFVSKIPERIGQKVIRLEYFFSVDYAKTLTNPTEKICETMGTQRTIQ